MLRDKFIDLPRDETGDILEPYCYSALKILPEWDDGSGRIYLWDLNGVPLSVEEITGKPEDIDRRLQAWCEQYDGQSSDAVLFEGDPLKIKKFNDDGEALACELFAFFNGTKVIHYYPQNRPEVILK